MDESKIINLTDAYMISYSRAYEKTHNPTLAINIASSVLFVYANTQPKEEKPNWMQIFKDLIAAQKESESKELEDSEDEQE